MRVASFFAGIGGFDLGLERAGMSVVFQCEIDHHAQMILRKHWPHVPLHGDITELEPTTIPSADLWCAGWPCQDLSNANSTGRTGLEGARSGLFYTLSGLLSKSKPRWIVLENVPGLLSAGSGADFETVIDVLEEIGYVGGWISANLVDAGLPHNRDRILIVGSLGDTRAIEVFLDGKELSRDFAKGRTSRERKEAGPHLCGSAKGHYPLVVQRRGGFGYTGASNICPTIRAQTGRHQGGHSDRPILCGQKFDLERVREANGLPARMDGRRGRLIGNAVSPIIVEWLGRRIMEIEARYAVSSEASA